MQSSPVRSKGRILVGVAALGALAAGATSVAFHTIDRGTRPSRRADDEAVSETAADVDALAREAMPPDDENAWALLRTLPPGALGFGSESLPTLERGAPPSPEELGQADEAAAALPISTETIALLDAALARPRLVVDCTFDRGSRCPLVTVLRALDAAVLLALRDAGHGDAVTGVTRTTHALRLARDRIESARSMIELAIATRAARRLLVGAALVAARVQARGAEAMGPAIADALTAMGEQVEAMDAMDWSPDRALVGEALSVRNMVELTARSDPRASSEWANAYFDEVRAHARDPERVTPPPPPDPDRWGSGLDPFHIATTIADHAPMVAHLRASHLEAAREAAVAARVIESARAASLRIQ